MVYGIGFMALDQSAIVVQVPDFGDRFWVYSAYDTRTDEFSQLGKMYGNKPGFYLMVGPNWTGETPKGITKVFRATTNRAIRLNEVNVLLVRSKYSTPDTSL